MCFSHGEDMFCKSAGKNEPFIQQGNLHKLTPLVWFSKCRSEVLMLNETTIT